MACSDQTQPMLPDQYCQHKAAGSGSSFYACFRFLPPARRKAITALYAFCREVDDIVDDRALPPESARYKLAGWRREITDLYAGHPDHPITRALLPHLASCSLEQAHFMAIIDGMEMDLDRHRYSTFDELARYCWHVAGAVGILAAKIFGASRPETLLYAEKLGLAFQLTNIIRDVGEDLAIGRIYLPADEMARFGVTETDLARQDGGAAFTGLMRFQADRALALYDKAFSLLPEEDRPAQKPGIMMASIYRELLLEIVRCGFPVLTRRVSLTKGKKLGLAWKAWLHE